MLILEYNTETTYSNKMCSTTILERIGSMILVQLDDFHGFLNLAIVLSPRSKFEPLHSLRVFN
jgi:hypothetical protein